MTQVPCAGLDAHVAGDGRDGDVGDRRVEHVHEGRQRQRQRAQHPLRALQRRRTRAGGACGAHRRGCRLASMMRRTCASASAQLGGLRGGIGRRGAAPPARRAARAPRPCFVQMHGGLHRQADAQRVLGQRPVDQLDAHRHALHHLDPVAGGVLRRQQRKGRAGAGTDAGDAAAIFDLAAVGVGVQRHRLADAHAAQLHFLEIGLDPDAVQRDQRHQHRARRHMLADLHRAPRHLPGLRRAQLAAAAAPARPRAAPRRRAARWGGRRCGCPRSAPGCPAPAARPPPAPTAPRPARCAPRPAWRRRVSSPRR